MHRTETHRAPSSESSAALAPPRAPQPSRPPRHPPPHPPRSRRPRRRSARRAAAAPSSLPGPWPSAPPPSAGPPSPSCPRPSPCRRPRSPRGRAAAAAARRRWAAGTGRRARSRAWLSGHRRGVLRRGGACGVRAAWWWLRGLWVRGSRVVGRGAVGYGAGRSVAGLLMCSQGRRLILRVVGVRRTGSRWIKESVPVVVSSNRAVRPLSNVGAQEG